MFDERLAEHIVARGIVVSPTIQTTYRELEELETRGEDLTATERQLRDAYRYKIETKLDFVGRFHRLGAKIVAGTDAIQRFGDFALGLELLHRAGLSPMEVIVAATSLAAQAVGMDETVGTLKPDGRGSHLPRWRSPARSRRAVWVDAVVLAGDLVVDRRQERCRADRPNDGRSRRPRCRRDRRGDAEGTGAMTSLAHDRKPMTGDGIRTLAAASQVREFSPFMSPPTRSPRASWFASRRSAPHRARSGKARRPAATTS